jgi:branched-chain amino acid transport system substrate-binding protein
MVKMREMPVRDAFTEDGVLREDGRMAHSMYLFEVKKPESRRAGGTTTNCSQRFRPSKPLGR